MNTTNLSIRKRNIDENRQYKQSLTSYKKSKCTQYSFILKRPHTPKTQASESSNCRFIKQHPYIQRNRSNQVGNICICQEKMRILQLKTDNGHSSALQQHYQQKEISLGNGTDRISS